MKKNLYSFLYALSSLLIFGSIIYYILFLQKEFKNLFNNGDRFIKVALNHEVQGQKIARLSVSMGYSTTEEDFEAYKLQLQDVLPKWQTGFILLRDGDELNNIEIPFKNEEYIDLQKKMRTYYDKINISATTLIGVKFSENEIKNDSSRLGVLITSIQKNTESSQNINKELTKFLESKYVKERNIFRITEWIVIAFFGIIILIQGLLIINPLIKFAGDNFLSKNKVFHDLKASERKLRVSFIKQTQINKKLMLSRLELEQKNTELVESENKLLKSTEEQVTINQQLIQAQEALNQAYTKKQNSEEEIRELATKQLEDNEKLFLAEKKMKLLLEEEQKAKDKLKQALNNLKATQSQLVHSEKMASLGQLTAGIAHEINNPINFISSGMSSLKMSIESITDILVEYSKLDNGGDFNKIVENIKNLKEEHEYDEIMEELDDLIKDVNYGVTRTIEIVKGLRIFSRLDEEEVKISNVNENLDATLVLLKNKTKNKIKVSKYYDKNMQAIECYPGQLNQVFMNILNNGIQAIPENKEDGEIKVYTEDKKDKVVIRLTDNGVGIPDEIKKRIWEPFFTTKPVGVGTGLGMSITYGIIEKHNGVIDLHSELGKGSEFVISIPKIFRESNISQNDLIGDPVT